MNPLEILNQNPALTSLIAFPLGLVLLLATAKHAGLGKVYTDTLGAIKNHTAAEVKIELRLVEIVTEIKNVVAAQWDNRRYIDDKLDHVSDRFDAIDSKLDTLLLLIPKRKADDA